MNRLWERIVVFVSLWILAHGFEGRCFQMYEERVDSVIFFCFVFYAMTKMSHPSVLDLFSELTMIVSL